MFQKDIASPISTDQLFQLWDQELFPENLQNSEVSSCSNCCYEESSYSTNLSFSSFSSFPSDRGKSNNNNSSTTLTPTNTNNLSIIFDCQDELDNDISASIDFSPQSTFSSVPSLLATQHDHQLDLSSLQCQIPLTDVSVNGFSSYSPDPVVHLKGPPLPSVFEDDCLSPLPSYVRLDPSSPSCSFIDPILGSFLPGNLNTRIHGDVSGVFAAGNILMGSDLQPQELKFEGDDCGIYGSDPMQQVYNSGDIQVLHDDSSQLINGGGTTSTLTSEISTLEETTFKVGKLSAEERKEKIHRYMKKRNERNFSKKIKYACRKTLADSRPRVRGRFAKNDEFGEPTRPSCNNHEDEDDEEVAMKEKIMVDHSDIFAHISGFDESGFSDNRLPICLIFSRSARMEEALVNATKDDQENEDSPIRLKKDRRLIEDNGTEFTESKSNGLLGGGESKDTLTSDVKQSSIGEICIQKSLFQSEQVTDVKKLKRMHFGSLNEKHLLQHYMDLAKVRPSDSLATACSPSSPYNIAVKLRSSKMEILFDRLKPIKSRRRNTCDLGSFDIDCPSAAGQGNLVISPVRQLTVGAIAAKDNVKRILKSPIICHLGALDDDKKSENVRSTDIEEAKCSQIMSSPEELSTSSTNSKCSNQSSSSAFALVSQGMLHCKWKGGIPYFVFSVDDQREIYVANLWKVESSNDEGLDYMYSFHSRTDGQHELGTSDNCLDLVGKMKVSSSFSLCPNSLRLMETEFVLFGPNARHPGEMQSLIPTTKKNWRLSKKVVNAFRISNPSKYKSRPEGVPSSINEDLSGEQCQEMGEPGALDSMLLQSNLSPNLELAAIIVRDYVHDTCQEASVGGWGLKFLEKVRTKQANNPVEDFGSLERCQESSLRNRNNCSTSVDVLIPAGFHGGPSTRNGGPSSLTTRWRSGGHCDCGGWDIGCPLTLLHNMSSKEALPLIDAQGECKSFDLFMQGTKQGKPTLRMVNIRDGLYFIQSTLTALQTFSIGVAIIHSQSSTLCPKDVKKLQQQEPKDNNSVVF
ncbi:hypothetical protein NE237_016099 [Protea cynaroides]|uniref:CCT domain-containing protein n=1 Tax=Protea cynaroides TaxID=273540 RepID=A0A9Q0KF11_9MAGN|nr:hypothetical protein NE237_016099 [Protea cynaroides]